MPRNPVFGGMAKGYGSTNHTMRYGKMRFTKGGKVKWRMGGAIPTQAIKVLRTTGTYKTRGVL